MLWKEDKWADSGRKMQGCSDLLPPFLCQWEYLYIPVQRKTACFLPKEIIYDAWRTLFIHIDLCVFRESCVFPSPAAGLWGFGLGLVVGFLGYFCHLEWVFFKQKVESRLCLPSWPQTCKDSQFFFTSRKLVYSFPSPPRHTHIHTTAPAHAKPPSPSSTQHLLKVLRGLYSAVPPPCFSLCLSAGCVAMKTALSQPV